MTHTDVCMLSGMCVCVGGEGGGGAQYLMRQQETGDSH